MPADGESLKEEMSALLRGDIERAREKRHAPVPEPPARPEPPPVPEPEPVARLRGRLFRRR